MLPFKSDISLFMMSFMKLGFDVFSKFSISSLHFWPWCIINDKQSSRFRFFQKLVGEQIKLSVRFMLWTSWFEKLNNEKVLNPFHSKNGQQVNLYKCSHKQLSPCSRIAIVLERFSSKDSLFLNPELRLLYCISEQFLIGKVKSSDSSEQSEGK